MCGGELARALPTRVAASMHNLGSMSLEVDLSTRGAPCTCSADVSRKSTRANSAVTRALTLKGSRVLTDHAGVLAACENAGVVLGLSPECL